ncbi:DUF4230 domain-containing protein [Streptomyces sp. NPDC059740]|uniref:DUF4230 domain-containing protein n=1 Tax=Streptomyces sp. NPDC059740 TaxID=3346926 RepID=UPI0036669445
MGLLLALVVLLLAAVLFLLAAALHLVPGIGDLFGETTTDHTGPALLKSVRDLDRYEAAEGSFQVVVDLDKDAKFLPDAVRGSRTLYVGAGTVDSYVDLGGLGASAVRTDKERTRAELWLPHARLGKAALDAKRSHAVVKERGFLDRLGDFFSDNPGDEHQVNQLAVRHITDAAKESRLTARAERNTTTMLRGLLGSLGFREVTVHYGQEPPAHR